MAGNDSLTVVQTTKSAAEHIDSMQAVQTLQCLLL